jgi:hypothetical protein
LKRAKLHPKWSRIIIRTAERDKLHFAISRHASPRGGFLFHERNAHHSLKSPNSNVSWTRIPLHISSAKKLTLNQTPVITVTGKAFSMSVILLKIKN